MATEIALFEQQLMPLAPRFEQVLDGTMKVERLMRTIVLSVERLPKLLDCTRQSLFNAAMSAAVLGLEVDGVTGQAYLIPFKGSAQLVIGYKGFNTLAARSGITITGAVVREGDEFDYELGSAAYVRHKPKTGPTKDRRIIAAWACAQSMTRPAVISVMNIDELMAVKTKSPGGARSDSPWNDPNIGFPAMCEKTVKRRLSRSMPLNVMQLAARMDEAVDEQGKTAWISPDKTIVVDGEFSDMPARNNETPTVEALTSPARTTPRAAAPAQSPSSPGTPAEQGAAVIPTAAEYVERWAVIVSGAADAKQLHTTWADQKGERDVIVWTDEHPFAVLKERVEKAIEFLKR